MQSNRTTRYPDEPPIMGQAPPATRNVRPPIRAIARAVLSLVREHRRIKRLPTRRQVYMLASLEGTQPCSYLLDPEVNYLPPREWFPVGMPVPWGEYALACSCPKRLAGWGSEMVILPSGIGFSL